MKQLATSCPTSSERDFFRWLKLLIPVYKAAVPVKLDASNSAAVDGIGTAEISLVLPSDHLRALHDQGPEASPSQKNMYFFFLTIIYLPVHVAPLGMLR